MKPLCLPHICRGSPDRFRQAVRKKYKAVTSSRGNPDQFSEISGIFRKSGPGKRAQVRRASCTVWFYRVIGAAPPLPRPGGGCRTRPENILGASKAELISPKAQGKTQLVATIGRGSQLLASPNSQKMGQDFSQNCYGQADICPDSLSRRHNGFLQRLWIGRYMLRFLI